MPRSALCSGADRASRRSGPGCVRSGFEPETAGHGSGALRLTRPTRIRQSTLLLTQPVLRTSQHFSDDRPEISAVRSQTMVTRSSSRPVAQPRRVAKQTAHNSALYVPECEYRHAVPGGSSVLAGGLAELHRVPTTADAGHDAFQVRIPCPRQQQGFLRPTSSVWPRPRRGRGRT